MCHIFLLCKFRVKESTSLSGVWTKYWVSTWKAHRTGPSMSQVKSNICHFLYYSCLFLHVPIWGHIEKWKQKTSSCCFSHEPSSFLVNLASDPVPFLCRIMNTPFIYSSSICLDPPYWKILYLYQAYLFPPTFRSPDPP